MSEIEKLVYAILSDDAALTALVPATRIYPDGELQNVTLPAIKHFVIDDESVYTHDGRAALRRSNFYQVSVFGSTLKQVRQIAEAVIDALGKINVVGSPPFGVHGFHTGTTRLAYDADVRAVGLAVNFEIWYGD